MKPRGYVDGLVFLAAVDQLVSRGAAEGWIERKAGLSNNQIYRVRSGRSERVYRKTFEAVLALRDDVRDKRVRIPKPRRVRHGTRSCYVGGCRRMICARAARVYKQAYANVGRPSEPQLAPPAIEPEPEVDGRAARAVLGALLEARWSRGEIVAAGVTPDVLDALWAKEPPRVPADVLRRMEHLLSVKRPVSPWADRRAS